MTKNWIYLFDGPAVPAGKRLVITHLSGRLPNNSVTNVSVALQASQIISLQAAKWAFFGPFFTTVGPMAGFSAEAFATYGPGERPHFNVVLTAANNFFGFVTVSGYLIDAN